MDDSFEDAPGGYKVTVSEWVWDAARYADADEPDSWGALETVGPKGLDDVLKALGDRLKGGRWLDGRSFESKAQKGRKEVRQFVGTIDRVDGKPLTYDERSYVETRLGLR